MKHNLTTPCKDCPFRKDVIPYLTNDRVREITEAVTRGQQSFSCHKTTTSVGKSNMDEGAEHCAGAMIMLEKMDQPNQMMRIMERIGMYDRTKLDMNAPVYESTEEMVEVYEEFNG